MLIEILALTLAFSAQKSQPVEASPDEARLNACMAQAESPKAVSARCPTPVRKTPAAIRPMA
jgi:hypothetical protein